MNSFEHLHIADLIVKSFAGSLNEEEEAKLRSWREASEENEQLFREILTLEGLGVQQEERLHFVPEKVWKRVQGKIQINRKRNRISRDILKYAAIITVSCGLAIFAGHYLKDSTPEGEQMTTVVQSRVPAIAHGSSRALLVLDDGSTIELDQESVFKTPDATVKNTDKSGVISYRKEEQPEQKAVKMNRLIVPRGGEYNIELADGTLVYLNAESELVYPVAFTGDTREVTLKGEAYFKVTRDSQKPFIVKSDGLSIRVWGTEFNLNTLRQQGYYAATLVEGKVEVEVPGGQSVFLEPSQQARVNCETSEISCVKVNTLPYTAWRDGKFVFNHENMQDITSKLEKWYDVEFDYADEKLKDQKVFGIISRYEDITKVLKLLSSTRMVNFLYVDHKIKVVSY